MVASGQFSVSILAGDQVDVGQYFSYPGRKFRYIADEYLEALPDGPADRPRTPSRGCAARRSSGSAHRPARPVRSAARPRAVLRPRHRVRRRPLEGAAAAVLQPARLAHHGRQGPRARLVGARPAARTAGRRRLRRAPAGPTTPRTERRRRPQPNQAGLRRPRGGWRPTAANTHTTPPTARAATTARLGTAAGAGCRSAIDASGGGAVAHDPCAAGRPGRHVSRRRRAHGGDRSGPRPRRRSCGTRTASVAAPPTVRPRGRVCRPGGSARGVRRAAPPAGPYVPVTSTTTWVGTERVEAHGAVAAGAAPGPGWPRWRRPAAFTADASGRAAGSHEPSTVGGVRREEAGGGGLGHRQVEHGGRPRPRPGVATATAAPAARRAPRAAGVEQAAGRQRRETVAARCRTSR